MPYRDTSVRRNIRRRVASGHPPCHICGKPIDYSLTYPEPMSFVVDHLVPTERGGGDDLANARAAHNTCNRAKSDKHHAPIVRRSPSLA